MRYYIHNNCIIEIDSLKIDENSARIKYIIDGVEIYIHHYIEKQWIIEKISKNQISDLAKLLEYDDAPIIIDNNDVCEIYLCTENNSDELEDVILDYLFI